MIKKNVFAINTGGKLSRDVFLEIKDFVNRKPLKNDDVNKKFLALGGLHGTGKTTLLEQTLESFRDSMTCAYYQVEEGDSADDVLGVIKLEKKKRTQLICLDDITNSRELVENAAYHFNKFYDKKIRLIITGALTSVLYNARYEMRYSMMLLNLTYMSFPEYCRVYGRHDIENYIFRGGMLDNGTPWSYERVREYIVRAVSENVMRHKDGNVRFCGMDAPTFTQFLLEYLQLMVDNDSNRLWSRWRDVDRNSLIGRLESKWKDSWEKEIALFSAQPIRELADCLDTTLLISKKTAKTVWRFDWEEVAWWKKQVREFYFDIPVLRYYLLRQKRMAQCAAAGTAWTDEMEIKTREDVLKQVILHEIRNCLGESYATRREEYQWTGKPLAAFDVFVETEQGRRRYWPFEVRYGAIPRLTDTSFKDETLRLFASLLYKRYHEEALATLYRGKSLRLRYNPLVWRAFANSRPPDDRPSYLVYLNIADFLLTLEKCGDLNAAWVALTKALPAMEYYQNVVDQNPFFYHGETVAAKDGFNPERFVVDGDFGRAFYVSTERRDEIDRVATGSSPCLYGLKIPADIVCEGNTLKLDLDEWLYLVLYNRGMLEDLSDTKFYAHYAHLADGRDFVVGPFPRSLQKVALREFCEDYITDTEFKKLFLSMHTAEQVAVMSDKGRADLEDCGVWVLDEAERKHAIEWVEAAAKYDYDDYIRAREENSDKAAGGKYLSEIKAEIRARERKK